MEFGANLTTILFDFDGTLFDLDVDWDALRRDLDVPAERSLGDAIGRMVDADDPRLDLVTAYELRAVGDRRIGPGTAAALARLAQHHAIGVCTRNSRLAVLRAFEGTSVHPTLTVVGREDVRRLKPDPEGLLLLLDRLGAAPSSAALVGDTYHDVRGARAAGIRSFVVRNDRLAYPPQGADRYLELISDLVTDCDEEPRWATKI